MCAARFDDGDLHGVLPMTAVNTNGKDNILHSACRGGKLGMVKRIISQSIVSIDSKGQFGRTPVMYAASKGHVVIFKLLVREGADVFIVDDNGSNILHLACMGGHLGMVKHIISKDTVSIDSKGQFGRTPVIFAAEKGQVAVFKLLVREGADVYIVDDNAYSILHVACMSGNVDMVKHVISQNIVSIDSKGQCGNTPLMYAAQQGHMAVFKLLVREGADVSIVDDNGNNILHLAGRAGKVDMVKHIISQNIVSINSTGQDGSTPVIWAAQQGQVAVFKTLESEGADLSIGDIDGDNILHVACAGGHPEMVKYIISRNLVSIDSKGAYGRTHVMYAANKGHVAIFKLLVREGADVSILDDNGTNILQVACIGGDFEMVKHIISQNMISIDSKGQYGRTPVMDAAQKGHVGMFKLLVREGADVSIVDDNGDNILHAACACGNLDMVKHIISKDIVSIESKGKFGTTPVMFAAENGHVAVFKLLVREGADVFIVSDRGTNILHVACIGGNLDMVKHVISRNIVSIDSKGKHGRTSVIYTAQVGHMAVFKTLESEGADLSIVDIDGENILNVACANGNLDMVKYIISRNIVSIGSKGQYGRTPVMHAAENGHVAIFKMLVREGVNLSVVDDHAYNILHLACLGGNVDIVKYVISQNVISIDIKGEYGRTPVMYVAAKGHVGVFKLLVREGADVSIVDDNGNNILHVASRAGNVDMVKHIISQNIVSIDSTEQDGSTPVIWAAHEGNVAVFKTLESEGADLSIVDIDGENILHVACGGGHPDMVKYIISRNLVSIDSKAEYGRTPVMYAAEKGNVDVIKLLVTEGTDLSIANDNGDNILHAACEFGNLDMVKYIITRNIVSIDSKGQYGTTPLMYAAKERHIDVITLLVTEGTVHVEMWT